MATCQFQEPKLFIAENTKAPLVRIAPQGSGHTGNNIIRRGDFVTITAGTLARSAANVSANVFGLAIHGELQEFTEGTPAFGLDYSNQLFGAGQVSTATSGGLIPAEPGNVHVNALLMNQLFEISMTSTTGWVSGGASQVNIGSTFGLNIDATTQLFIGDTTQANKIFTVYNISTRGGIGGSGFAGAGQAGDTGILVLAFANSGVV